MSQPSPDAVSSPAYRSPEDLKGQVAVITGSTSGIGLALAEAVAARGGDVVLNGLGDPAQIEATRAKLAADHGVRVLYHDANMMHGDQVADMVAYAHRELGRIDILVNNAGIQFVSPVEDFPPERWTEIHSIVLTASFQAIRCAVPGMKRRGCSRG